MLLVRIWSDAAERDWRASRDMLARRFPERWGRQAEMAPQGKGLSITLHLGEGAGEPKPAIELRQTRCRTVAPGI